MGVADVQDELVALLGGTIANAVDFERLLVAIGDADDHVVQQSAGQAVQSAVLLAVVGTGNEELSTFLLDGHARLELLGQGTLGALDGDKIAFRNGGGVPVAVDGEKMKVSDIIRKLNKLGGENGVGILDIVENRLIGMKDHGIYETPGGTILYFAHEQLEMLTLDKETLHMKEKLAVDYADLIYNGKWYSPLQEALTAFAKKSNEYCTGTVNIKLYKGNMINAGITSPYSLYSENLVTFGESDFNQAEAAGFINIWGLPTKVQALREQGKL